MSNPKLNIKEETSTKKTRSPPKKTRVEQSVPKKKKLKLDADKAAEKAQHLRFGKAELTPDELSRLSKAQKREMYAAHAARSAVHREVDQYEDENVGVQALSEGEKAAETTHDIAKSRYARKLKKKAKMQGKKGTKTAKSSAREPTAAQDAGASGTSEGGSNWLSRWRQKQDIRQSYYAAARSGTAAQTAGGKAVSNGASAARSGVEQAVEKGKTAVSTAVKGLMNAAKGNAHVLVIVGVFLLLILMVMSGFSSCGILFSGGTQVSGQTMYSAEDRDIRGAEQDYKKLEKELDKKIKRTPADHPGYNEYQYHLDPIEHDPWQLTSYLTTLYDDYTRSEVQGKLKETFKKQYKLTTWVEVQIRYMTVWVISPLGIPVPTQVPYEYRIFHTKLVNRGLEVVIREELNADQSIDGKKVLVQADRAKTKSSLRTLPLVPPIRDRLLMLKGQQDTYRRLCGKSYNREYLGYLCVDEIGNIIRPNYVSEQFPKLLEKNGLRHIRFHDLRHSCASLLLANGVPMKQIQEWLGHSDFSTTANIYAHLDYASKLSSAQAMMEGLGYGNASA